MLKQFMLQAIHGVVTSMLGERWMAQRRGCLEVHGFGSVDLPRGGTAGMEIELVNLQLEGFVLTSSEQGEDRHRPAGIREELR
jgi:hypothetical protein